MKRFSCPLALILILAAPAIDRSAAAPMAGFPFADENLDYSINWPSGLSLGEAHMHSRHSGANWSFEFTVDAGIPGYQVKDTYQSAATPDFCSVSFDRNTSHGGHTASGNETVQGTTVTRSDGPAFTVPACVKDALALLYFARRELGQGRVPSPQPILFGRLYNAQLEYAGADTILIGEKPVESDKLTCTIGGHSSYTFEIWFARDAARTPLLVKAPFAVGTFSMELVR